MDSASIESRTDSSSLHMVDQKQPSADWPRSGPVILFEWAMCITMFKKGYIMNSKTSSSSPRLLHPADLTAAVEQFVAQGGVIDVIHAAPNSPSSPAPSVGPPSSNDIESLTADRLLLLKELVAKGAGISALQYSLRMNKRAIKQLAIDHGIKIAFSRPVLDIKRAAKDSLSDIDDVTAGHAMHYSSLGYTVHEIARLLGLSDRDVWNMGKAYRFEFRQNKDSDTP